MNGRLAIAALWLLLASLYIATAVEGTPVVEAKCDPGRPHQENPDPGTGGNYFDGWFRNSSAWVTGVIADIYNYSPWVEPINGFISASLATVMLAESAPNGDDYAQVGWVEYPMATAARSSNTRYGRMASSTQGIGRIGRHNRWVRGRHTRFGST